MWNGVEEPLHAEIGQPAYTINQSIKGPHKATHGPRRSHIPAPPQGGQALHHEVMQAWGAMSESRQH